MNDSRVLKFRMAYAVPVTRFVHNEYTVHNKYTGITKYLCIYS